MDGKAPVPSHCPNVDPPRWLWPGYHCRQDRDLRIRYELTCGDYWRLFAHQRGRCAVCGGRPASRRLAVDHDHDTGEVRGLAHVRCQRWITTAVVRYLADPPGRVLGLQVPSGKLRRLEAKDRARRRKQATKRAAATFTPRTDDEFGRRVKAALQATKEA